jgi:hypothetical protein
MIGLSGKPLGGGLSPVWPGPGTNGEVLGTTAGDEDADKLLDGAEDVLSGAEELLSEADELLSDADELLSDADELLSDADELLSDADELLGGVLGGVLAEPHGPWLRLN